MVDEDRRVLKIMYGVWRKKGKEKIKKDQDISKQEKWKVQIVKGKE